MKIRGIFTKLLLAGLFVVIISMITYGMESEIKSSSEEIYLFEDTFTQSSRNPFSFDLTPHSPIDIDSNDDFASLGFNGSGSETDPYIIEGYIITSTDLATSAISITGTTVFFTIRNCYLDGDYCGILISNIAEDMVEITNNTCIDAGYGISISDTQGSILSNNTCLNCWYGIIVHQSSHIILTSNICYNHEVRGISVFESLFCSLSNNTLENNGEAGIRLADSDSCLVYYNRLIDNYINGPSQAEDNGKKNKWYNPETKAGNFWSDLGNRCKYAIDGSAHSKDLYPLNRALSCPNPIMSSTLAIVIPIIFVFSLLAFLAPKYIIPYIRKKNLKEITASWFRLKKGRFGIILLIVALCIGAAASIFWGTLLFMWEDAGRPFLALGSILLAFVVGIIFVWIRYPDKLFRKKPVSEEQLYYNSKLDIEKGL
ncbi:MAG: right-handed parallel beta-helix repeat-containing protein [Candidatus Heimdallarchaeota archaeon]|nr:right-handed parallel beta-helix repeat-containing protein [Candidatus Heimdallarchaeota archaeon]MCK4876813.1 right-handed parallel beta-helix repeat-containing protein [Candidatus Heimdallarchaeota archaeon]